jgi:predicted phosphodiesterase
MRIVILSDTHGEHRRVRVPQGDVLIHCGDLATRFLGEDKIGNAKDGLDWLNEQEHKHILFVPGNHDSVYGQHWFNLGRVVWLNGETRVGGLRIWGQGWGRKYDFEHCDILVSHVPAYGILDEQQGCREL